MRLDSGEVQWCAHAKTLQEALLKTLREEGLAGLYSGLESSLLGIGITNGVYYAFCASTLPSTTHDWWNGGGPVRRAADDR